MFDLEKAILNWKRDLFKSPGLEEAHIVELEESLRDEIEDLIGQGLSKEEAFRRISSEMASTDVLGFEFYKVRRKRSSGHPSWHAPQFMPALFWNYLKVSLRKIKLQKSYSIINIAGLAVGMASAILIMMWVYDELNYDKFHTKADRIYRMVRLNSEDLSEGIARVGAPWGPALIQDYPEVENFVRFRFFSRSLVRYEEKSFYEDEGLYADPSIFEVFSFPFTAGDPASALTQPGSIVITEKMALKYFGNNNPISKTLTFNNEEEMQVSGVLKNIPKNSHFHFDFLIPFSMYDFFDLDNWTINNFHTYLLLRDKADSATLEKNLPEFVRRHTGEEISDSTFVKLQPLNEIHLHSNLLREFEPNGDIRYVYMFIVIAFFILTVACINFINLTTAKASNRAKEIGLRKVVGAKRTQLVQQFLGESVLTCLFSLLIAFLLIRLVLPFFNSLTGKALTLNLTVMHFILFALAILLGLVSGIYPSLILSGFHPVSVIKGMIKTNTSSLFVRRGLVLLQFTISIILIVGTIVVYQQMGFIQNNKLGFQKEQILIVRMANSNVQKAQDVFRNELLKNLSVRAVSASSNLLGGSDWGMTFQYEGMEEGEEFGSRVLVVDHHFLDTYSMEIVKGRNFSETFSTDEAGAYLLNEAAVIQLGWENPIGKKFGIADESGESDIPSYERGHVIGVVKNFNFRSLHQSIQPLAMFMVPDWNSYFSVKISPRNVPSTLSFIKKTWESHETNLPFDHFFIDETFNGMYKEERRVGKAFGVFSLIAISIACLGLFSLSAFTIERRSKEMGIRKILGATSSSILFTISKEFVKLVLLANLFAWPLAYYFMHSWLQRFAFRIDMSFIPFLFSGMIVLIIAMISVSIQSIKAAVANPVESLRSV